MDESPRPALPSTCLVLVADDHAALRSMIGEALRAHGYEVDEAVDGRQALQLLRRRRHRAAVIDVRMPVVDGLAVCAEVQREQLPCSMIVISVVADAETQRRVAELGAAFHQKPFELAALLADVQRACAGGPG